MQFTNFLIFGHPLLIRCQTCVPHRNYVLFEGLAACDELRSSSLQQYQIIIKTNNRDILFHARALGPSAHRGSLAASGRISDPAICCDMITAATVTVTEARPGPGASAPWVSQRRSDKTGTVNERDSRPPCKPKAGRIRSQQRWRQQITRATVGLTTNHPDPSTWQVSPSHLEAPADPT
jgi:hypothetical protein